jgi:hypothetical protein
VAGLCPDFSQFSAAGCGSQALAASGLILAAGRVPNRFQSDQKNSRCLIDWMKHARLTGIPVAFQLNFRPQKSKPVHHRKKGTPNH